MVRFGDFLYIRNNFPNQPNLCYESDTKFPAGEELWKAHAAGSTTPDQQQVFANPCPEEELFQVSDDPHQLTNMATNSRLCAGPRTGPAVAVRLDRADRRYDSRKPHS